MAVVHCATVCALFGVLVVVGTSFTLQQLLWSKQISMLLAQAAFADLSFAGVITLVLLCHFEPQWIAQNHSFPYSSQPEWTFGRIGFDFQLLVFEIFHQQWSSRLVHTVNILCEGFFWIVVTTSTFGLVGQCLVVFTLTIQALSYGDTVVASAIFCLQLSYCVVSRVLLNYYETDTLLIGNVAKVAIFWCSFARTVNHAFEPLPPAYHPSVAVFDDGFGTLAWNLCLSSPLHAMGMMGLGLVSEVAAGSPGRFLNPIVFRILWRVGYRSTVLMEVPQAKSYAKAIIEGGWQAHPMTAELYSWTNIRPEKNAQPVQL